ncbi:hypothetical protein ALO95_101854 [Pseudomonas syringae pv. antirrhini]|uniref:Uncharacterized protein n=2 Tax=Pseudomonas syringae group genomosp. 3 TaxID=251701 RepID=A0A3M3N7D5_9PSED|nr:hypothetical protein ALO88_102219 [Pseudomonas syringae pv. antirrhini]RMN55451.1 hypothetical protein ALQ59_102281 [Pseudomonas syringae pv. apii]RMN94830.1 hypothetical protein ALQ49_101668 [Pseudomonas syringae pv. apii]RMP44882.1 hypothetical protein ALQ23_102012 [Pseudomonas syringae pv. antirrhini]RMW29510.1 hypothetical protein ALO95_101854 [Pseudomonas syringae pv. antirrhini]
MRLDAPAAVAHLCEPGDASLAHEKAGAVAEYRAVAESFN